MTHTTTNPSPSPTIGQTVPRGDLAGFVTYFRHDILSGFMVFLIAMPLCLAISQASGFPPIAGVFTAIVGSILTTFISNSELTIKGPAAGLIVIVMGAVTAFGGDGMTGGFTDADRSAYRAALAVGVAAAILQVLFGVFRAGILAEFFPLSAVHGMLAAIGVIIMVKQFPVAIGVSAKGEPLEMIREIPHYIQQMNSKIAIIGAVGVAIMFLWPFVQRRFSKLKSIPAALLVLLVTIPLGRVLQIDEAFLVSMPKRVFGLFDEVTSPDFSVLADSRAVTAWKWVFMFFIIGSLESLLSSKAVDVIDPWKRKTNMNRDILAVGAANIAGGMVGGLPMISEIVRSKANIDNGARTRFADMWHGISLLVCVSLIPGVLHQIPLAALASMLIYTGFRLSHPSEFLHVWHIGKEQLLVFVGTLVGVLATDLLIGIMIGMAIEILVHLRHGAPLRTLFRSRGDVEMDNPTTVRMIATDCAIFTNWLHFRQRLIQVGIKSEKSVIVDFSQTRLVDHSVMSKLHELQRDFQQAGLSLQITGLEEHVTFSHHPMAARKRRLTPNK